MCFFFFKQKTAYDMRISDWSSDVCSSDLKTRAALTDLVQAARKTKWEEFSEAIGPLAQYAAPECLSAIATEGVTTDAALVVLQSLITRMEVMSDGPYRVEHDQSKNLATYHDLLCSFIDHEGEIELRQSEIDRKSTRLNSSH